MNTIWAGTDDGLVHVTHDGGKTWKNVTPPALTSWSKISQIDAGHSDTSTAYIAVRGPASVSMIRDRTSIEQQTVELPGPRS